MAKSTEQRLTFVCRDCGAKFAGDQVMVPGAEPLSADKTPIEANRCPKCGGILDMRFPSSE
jgi:ribosomal protein L40E